MARLRSQPDFELAAELDKLVAQHGASLALLHAVIEEKVAEKETACRLWADTLGPADSDGATYVESIQSNTAALVDGLTGGAKSCRPRAWAG